MNHTYEESLLLTIAAPRKAFSSTSSSRRSSGSNTEFCEASTTMGTGTGTGVGTGSGTASGTANIDVDAVAAGGIDGLVTPTATPVTDFYRDATVLITGGTGFVGKVLTEKLLRAFGLRKIYMLIRSKDNMSVQERLQGFFNESVSQ